MNKSIGYELDIAEICTIIKNKFNLNNGKTLLKFMFANIKDIKDVMKYELIKRNSEDIITFQINWTALDEKNITLVLDYINKVIKPNNMV